jgi:FkbM family methyltransferase
MSQDYRNCLLKSTQYLSENPLFFDIGCNINPIVEYNNEAWVENWNDDFTSLAFEYFPSAKCIGIEPLHYQSYEERWKDDDRVKLLKICLSDKDDKEILYYPGDRHVLTSFYLQEHFKGNGENINQIEIECSTLDTICEKENIPFIDYLKIDTEGAEFKILKGSEKLIQNKKIKFIQFEYGLSDKIIPEVTQICNFLKFYGYIEVLTSNREKLWTRL